LIVARDQRTRLQAELAHQYATAAGARKKAPGRNALTEELVETDAQEHEGELVEPHDPAAVEAQAEADVEDPEAAPEPPKSLFELPRKEPAKPPLVTDDKKDF
jgi:hypothetical protein